jgi:hypothetical protein
MTTIIKEVRVVKETRDDIVEDTTAPAVVTEPAVVVPTVTEEKPVQVEKMEKVIAEVNKKKAEPVAPKPVSVQLDAARKLLKTEIDKYVTLRQTKYPTPQQIELAIVTFAKITETCKTMNTLAGFQLVFDELFMLHSKKVLNPYGMFHALGVLSPKQRTDCMVFYEVMMKLVEFQTTTKARAFTLDLGVVENNYNASNFIQFIKGIVDNK